MSIFRELDANETAEFARWARDNFDPTNDTIEYEIWHPAVTAECEKMVAELESDTA